MARGLRKLGQSGLLVSPMCLGAMNFGNEQFGCDEGTSRGIIDAYLAAGHNFIDTANVYSGTMSESIIGRASQIAEAATLASAKGWEPLVSLQPQYSILARDIEVEIVGVCERFGLGIIPWSPLGGGMLTGKYKQGEEPESGTRFAAPGPFQQVWRRRALSERNHEIVQVVLGEAEKLGVSQIALSLAWNVGRPGVVAPII